MGTNAVIAAAEVVKVWVEQAHIDMGEVGRAKSCPVAIALARLTGPDDEEPEVYADSVWFRGRRWTPEPRFSALVTDFDAGRPVAPGEYRMVAMVRAAEATP